MGVLPRTRRRSVHDSRNLSRAPAASLRDRLRRPLTEPACRQVRQQSGSGEGRARSQRRGDLGDWAQDKRLTATVTATAAAIGHQQRPAAAHYTRTIRANWGYVRPEKAEGRRAISVQLTRVMRGHSRLLMVPEVGCSAGLEDYLKVLSLIAAPASCAIVTK